MVFLNTVAPSNLKSIRASSSMSVWCVPERCKFKSNFDGLVEKQPSFLLPRSFHYAREYVRIMRNGTSARTYMPNLSKKN